MTKGVALLPHIDDDADAWVLRWFRWVYLLIPYTEDPSSLIPTKTSARG